MSWWMKGMVKGYEGPNDMVLENAEPRTMFRRSPNAPYEGYEDGRKCGGKDARKWKDGTEAIVWRKRRHVLFQSMYEPLGMMPQIVIMSMGVKGK